MYVCYNFVSRTTYSLIHMETCEKRVFIHRGKEYCCSLELAMELIGGKWKTMMIFHLKDGALRSAELMRTLHGISNKMFTQTARELERDGIIRRHVYPVVPPKVEYELTDAGRSVLPIVLDMAQWGIEIATQADRKV
ncbi:winged helix-turn-helix transcriptional regulator [uncultured Alistipes sp.]|uniref:winged helix-turn-helix transcriptional regulator n=1 Tax=uncultured Alistipes sp. TaxID=538949 RepID=UPI00345D397D